MSLNMDMKRIRLRNCSDSMRKFFKAYWILWRISNAVNPGKFFHSNSIGSPSIPITDWKNSQLEKLPPGLSIVQLLPLKYESFPSKIPNPRRHILLSSSIFCRSLRATWNSSMKGSYSLHISHSVSLNRPLSIFWWHWTYSQYHQTQILGYVQTFGSTCTAAFIDDTTNHLHISILALKASISNSGSVLLPAYSASFERPSSCTQCLWPRYKVRDWFYFLVFVFLVTVSRSCWNNRVPVLEVWTLLIPCSSQRSAEARRTHIPFRMFGTYFTFDSLWLLMRTQRQTSTRVPLRRSPEAGGRFVCSVTHPKGSLAFWEFCLAMDKFRYDTRFIALDFAFTVGESSERPSWLRENVERFMMSSRCKRLFHSSRVKLPLVHKSVIWFLMSTYLIWILGSKLIPLNNQSNATRCVPDTCLMVGLLLWIIILITASLSSKMFQRDSPWEECAFTRTWSILDKSTCVVVICLGLGVIFGLATVSRELVTIEFALPCVERKTSITTSHRSRAGKPTIRNPASKDMISDSVELWDADVSCTSNWWRQMFGFRKNIRLTPEGDFESSRPQQSLSLEKILIDNAVLCFPHGNIDGSHVCDGCWKLVWPNVGHKLESILWLIGRVCWLH